MTGRNSWGPGSLNRWWNRSGAPPRFATHLGWYFSVDREKFIYAAGDNLLEAYRVAKERLLPGEKIVRFVISRSNFPWTRMRFGGGGVMKVQIRFIKAWGHPTRNQIMGVGEVWWVSPWVAENLCPEYAERVEGEEAMNGKD